MNTAKALYWIALGVFALGLNNGYQDGGFPGVHRAAGRAEAMLCRFATRAEKSLAVARVLVERSQQEFQADERFTVERQAELDRAQARLDRMRAALERAQVERLRVLPPSNVHFSNAAGRQRIVVCPETGQRIVVTMPDRLGVDAAIREIPAADSF